MTHICIVKLTIIGSDNGLSPGRRQTIIWANAGILLIEPLGTNFTEILHGIQTLSFKKMYLKMSSAKWRPFCLGLNVLNKQDGAMTWERFLHYWPFVRGICWRIPVTKASYAGLWCFICNVCQTSCWTHSWGDDAWRYQGTQVTSL